MRELWDGTYFACVTVWSSSLYEVIQRAGFDSMKTNVTVESSTVLKRKGRSCSLLTEASTAGLQLWHGWCFVGQCGPSFHPLVDSWGKRLSVTSIPSWHHKSAGSISGSPRSLAPEVSPMKQTTYREHNGLRSHTIVKHTTEKKVNKTILYTPNQMSLSYLTMSFVSSWIASQSHHASLIFCCSKILPI